MGVVNVTPDSFFDGGRFADPVAAVAQARRLIDEGADILDIGGESTRPGSEPVFADEQIRRVVPVIEQIRALWPGPISVDTTRAAVAAAALAAGANWVNDISALRDDPEMLPLVARLDCAVVLMHMQGTPRTMQVDPTYHDVVAEVSGFLSDRARMAESSGIPRDRIIIDPGIGFGKTLEHNLQLLRAIPRLVALGYPVLVGASRKSFIGRITGAPPEERLEGSLVAAIRAVEAGAKIIRVHDVASTRRALSVAAALTPKIPA
ncbi:MAG: dihydropteroate synthase [Candidatus Zixiibacteriota bacterium]